MYVGGGAELLPGAARREVRGGRQDSETDTAKADDGEEEVSPHRKSGRDSEVRWKNVMYVSRTLKADGAVDVCVYGRL